MWSREDTSSQGGFPYNNYQVCYYINIKKTASQQGVILL